MPLNLAAINQQLTELSRQISATVAEIDAAEREAIRARHEYDKAYSKAFVAAEGAMEARKHQTIVDTAEPKLAAEVAEQHVRALKRHMDTLKLRVDIGRSLGSALKAELGTLGGGP